MNLKKQDTGCGSAIQILVDLVSPEVIPGKNLGIFVWESCLGSQQQQQSQNSNIENESRLSNHSNTENEEVDELTDSVVPSLVLRDSVPLKRRLSNKIDAYAEIFQSAKVEFNKTGLLEKAFKPVYTGSSVGSIGFDIEGNYDATTHAIDIELGSIEDFATVTTARPYSMQKVNYPYLSSHQGTLDLSDIHLRSQEDAALISEISAAFTPRFEDTLPSPRKCDPFESTSIDMFLDYLGERKTCTSPVNLTWVNKVFKNNISVDSAMVESSTWQAIRATTYIDADKYAIQQLLFDNNRTAEFDDMFDFCKVCY